MRQLQFCNLKEARIFSSMLKHIQQSPVHSITATMRLAEFKCSGIASFFIRVLLEKHKKLPFRVIDALVDHFLRMRIKSKAIPLGWHQALLTFVTKYESLLLIEDKKALCSLSNRYN